MMMEFDDLKPIYIQIYEDLLTKVFREEIQLGEKLPSVREMAIEYTVNPTTIQRVINELDNHDLITKERGKGTYITKEQDKVDAIKNRVIKHEVNDFMERMRSMGLSKDAILNEIEGYLKGGEQS